MRLLSAILLFVFPALTSAHHSPDELIAELTVKIEAAGDSDPDLYYKRGTEYRALRKYSDAAADFRRVADLDRSDIPSRKSLAQVLLWGGDPDAAREAITDTLTLAKDFEAAVSYIVLAEIERSTKNYAAALDACAAAFKIQPKGEIDWYLLRAELQNELKLTEQQIKDLDEGYKATSSVVLRNEWIEALIEGGYFQTALPVIEKELAACRLKSSWLIRRARALTGLQQANAARADFADALSELDQRVHPLRPHPGLLADRSLVHASLGNLDLARADYQKAQSLDPDSWQLRKLARQFPLLSTPAPQL